jgi:hypothetical protein
LGDCGPVGLPHLSHPTRVRSLPGDTDISLSTTSPSSNGSEMELPRSSSVVRSSCLVRRALDSDADIPAPKRLC